MSAAYSRCFEPFTLAGRTLKNRIFVSGHTTNFGDDLMPTDRHVAYHAERAKGGVGLIFTEGIRVHPASLGRSSCIIGYDERALPGYRRIVEAVKEQDCRIFAQILHTGRQTTNVFSRMPPWSASAVPWTGTGPIPHAMTRSEMEEVIRSFVFSAELMREAGFDGLEVHFGHGHLLQQFLSPSTNKRTDEYGGSEENRLRFPLEVLRAVQAAVGDDLVVGIRVSGDEFLPDGLGVEESCQVIAKVCEAAPVDFVNASHSAYATPSIGFHVAEMNYGLAPFRPITYAVADAVPGTPVFAICRYTTLAVAEETLASGKVALVGMTRAHIADPHIVLKTRENREQEIRPCVSCNFCIGNIEKNLPMTCMMNPTVGKEAEWPVVPAKAANPKRVLVVGGGPAGLEAARLAAELGHTVTLWEQDDDLGGQLRTSRRGTGRADLGLATEYYQRQLDRLGVTVETNVDATTESILLFAADETILAFGSAPSRTTIEGYGDVPAAGNVLGGPLDRYAGKHVVLVDGTGSWTTSSVAETLATAGARVTIVAAGDQLLWDYNLYSKGTTLDRLSKLGVVFRNLRRPVRFNDGTLEIREPWSGITEAIPEVDAIIASMARQPSDQIARDLDGRLPNLTVIGDANAPRSMLEAIYEGHAAARAI